MKKWLKILLIILVIVISLFLLFNITYKIVIGTDCCSCCDDSQTVCISACCRCTFKEKIEKLIQAFTKN